MKQEDTSRNTMNIQWYPGHMTKTRRMIEEDVKLVDACVSFSTRASRSPAETRTLTPSAAISPG